MMNYVKVTVKEMTEMNIENLSSKEMDRLIKMRADLSLKRSDLKVSMGDGPKDIYDLDWWENDREVSNITKSIKWIDLVLLYNKTPEHMKGHLQGVINVLKRRKDEVMA